MAHTIYVAHHQRRPDSAFIAGSPVTTVFQRPKNRTNYLASVASKNQRAWRNGKET
jgi:hypothetical protein